MDSERAIRDSHPRLKKIAAAPPLALPRSLLRMSAVAGDGGKVFDQCNRLRRQAAQKAPASPARRGRPWRNCSYAGRAVCDLGARPKRNWPQCK